ncbi:thioesterase family protein [Azospirillum agricola]|uniref:thioesterase family protein n=1 Tax=Azospirillum agricola TaxID=1720247 RepID=UPI000A0F1D68|nr:thioesterase family protein [Azospirillum agricola]MBP2229262.1 acyl-CoA thioesterase FadM [Azospirillum agricola]SMH60543.1 Acyl-CoA thioesterase FadM [Azospirillum lipoferum]
MNLIFRLVAVVAGALVAVLRGRRTGLLDEVPLRFRVWPTDLDLNMHMTNARYFSLMDLGRTDLVIRGGLGRAVLRNRWQPVVGAANVRFRRSLKPFQRFTLLTRVLCWDDKYIFIEHRMETASGTAALAVVQGAFLARGRIVPPAEVMAAVGETGESPPMPESVAAWRGQPLSAAA